MRGEAIIKAKIKATTAMLDPYPKLKSMKIFL